jgi:TolA-binding protein
MVCSGRVPEVNYADDYAMTEEDGEMSSDLLDQLAMLDEDTSTLEDDQRREILEALGLSPNDPVLSGTADDNLLTEELFLDLEVQIAELERTSRKKSAVLDSLRMELQEADHQLAALSKVVGEPQPQFASTEAIPCTREPVFDTPVYTKEKKTNGHTIGHTNSASLNVSATYQDALDDVYAHRYETAIEKLTGLLLTDRGSDLADNSQYWIGECYFALGNYQQALAEFEKVFAFETNNKADDAQFMIGMTYLKLGDTELAEIEFNSLLSFYENSEYIAQAERKLDDLSI